MGTLNEWLTVGIIDAVGVTFLLLCLRFALKRQERTFAREDRERAEAARPETERATATERGPSTQAEKLLN
jgi:hypothetical protein